MMLGFKVKAYYRNVALHLKYRTSAIRFRSYTQYSQWQEALQFGFAKRDNVLILNSSIFPQQKTHYSRIIHCIQHHIVPFNQEV